MNVEYGMNSLPSLPPSSRNSTGFDVARVENGFHAIADSISTMFSCSNHRRPFNIDRDILNIMNEQKEAERNGAGDSFLRLYERMIHDLEAERVDSLNFYRRNPPVASDYDSDDSRPNIPRLRTI